MLFLKWFLELYSFPFAVLTTPCKVPDTDIVVPLLL